MSNYILAIGIDNYKTCSKLNNAVSDINNIIEVLTQKYHFEKSKTVKLINEDATLENVINQLEIFNSKQEAGDNLLILFSGHGDFDEKLQMGYIIPVDATLYSKSSYLPYSTIFNYIRALKSHHILLISDSCYSGSMFIPTRKVNASKEKLDKIPSKWAITSGRVELVSDGEPGKNSPFADSLIRILKENKETMLSVSEISNRIVSDVADKIDQIPRGEPLQLYGHKGGEFMFILKNEKTKINTINEEDSLYVKELVDEFYKIEDKIEEAENNNNVGTVRRLNEEKNSLNNILSTELLKHLETERTNLLNQSKIELPKEYLEKYQELLKLIDLKNKAVKNQKYEEAAKIRDDEKTIEKEINQILGSDKLISMLEFSVNSLIQDYSIFQILADIKTDIRIDDKKLIEKIFQRILFLNFSFTKGYISSFIYKDKKDSLVKEIKRVIKEGGRNESNNPFTSEESDVVKEYAAKAGQMAALRRRRKK